MKRQTWTGWSVHFAGGQRIKWALDEDLRWARQALQGISRPASARRSRIVHAAWWPSGLVLGTDLLADKTVVCFADNAPSFYARQPEFLAVRPFVDRWIARSRQALEEFSSLGIRAHFAPYCTDPATFCRLPSADAGLRALRRQLGVPDDAYLIGNFHSDTAFTLGPDRPKWQKGPDVFAEIVRRVRESEPRARVLLAGPRRHWLRRRLRTLGVPVYFVGREAEGDDLGTNVLNRRELNRLYNLLDLCLVSSRWEGGPHSLLEACFAGTKALSTRVGVAEDLLEDESLFNTIPEAVDRIVEDIRRQALEPTREPQYRRALAENTPQGLAEALRRIYQDFPQLPPKPFCEAACSEVYRRGRNVLRRWQTPPAVIGLLRGTSPGALFTFLTETLRQSSAIVLRDALTEDCRAYLADESWLRLNSIDGSSGTNIVMVTDDGLQKAPASVGALIVPSFKTLAEASCRRDRHVLVIPPFADGHLFDAATPVREQLTSTVEGVVQSIRQLFLVLEAPEDVRWLGFR